MCHQWLLPSGNWFPERKERFNEKLFPTKQIYEDRR